jgi:hypothetical protein
VDKYGYGVYVNYISFRHNIVKIELIIAWGPGEYAVKKLNDLWKVAESCLMTKKEIQPCN